jgi:hypothetical protein
MARSSGFGTASRPERRTSATAFSSDAIRLSRWAKILMLADSGACPRGTIRRMWEWIWIVALYFFSIGLLRWLGGVDAASDAIQRWGHAVARRRRRAVSSPS